MLMKKESLDPHQHDLPRWNGSLPQRVFQIQLLIEDKKFELADFQIWEQSKFMENEKGGCIDKKKKSLIGKVLIDLSRKSYDFKKVAGPKQKELNPTHPVELRLQMANFEPWTYRIQEWFMQIERENYNHKQVIWQKWRKKISPCRFKNPC